MTKAHVGRSTAGAYFATPGRSGRLPARPSSLFEIAIAWASADDEDPSAWARRATGRR